MDLPEALLRLDKLEDTLLAQIQELRIIRAEFQKQASNGQLEPLIDAQEVAKILDVEVDHVHAQARAGKIPSFKFGKYRKFSRSEIKKWLDKRANGETRCNVDKSQQSHYTR